MRRPLLTCFFAVSALTAGSCGGDSTGPSGYPPASLDQVLAELSSAGLIRPHVMFTNISAAGTPLDPAKCQYVPGAQSFACVGTSMNGVTITPSFTLLTAAGAKQAAFDPATTDAVRMTSTVGGGYEDQAGAFTVNGGHQLNLIGLVSGPHVVTGTSFISLTGSVTSVSKAYPVFATNEATVNLVFPPNATGSQNVWPSAGTIMMFIDGTLGPLTAKPVRTTITFSGTSTVAVTVTAGTVSQSCQVNLATSEPVCP